MANEVCFAQASERDEGNIVLVGQHTYKKISFLHTIAEILCTDVSVGHKWVVYHSLFTFEIAEIGIIIQRNKKSIIK